MNTVKIERSVQDIVNAAQYSVNDCPVDVIGIAKGLGFVVGNAVLNEEDNGFIVVEEGAEDVLGVSTDKLLGVNSKMSLEWKRFIIARELGHYVLHFKEKGLSGLYAHRDCGREHGALEWEADAFAMNLLVPKDSFMKRYEQLKRVFETDGEIVSMLSKYFSVSVNVIEKRITELI